MFGKNQLLPAERKCGTRVNSELIECKNKICDERRGTKMFGAITDWVDDYRTRKSGYGPPYFLEYGGDLPHDCNRLGADLMCVRPGDLFFPDRAILILP